jgi:hypothetical protein
MNTAVRCGSGSSDNRVRISSVVRTSGIRCRFADCLGVFTRICSSFGKDSGAALLEKHAHSVPPYMTYFVGDTSG